MAGFKSAQQRLLARSVCGGYLSPAAKASWDEFESPLCELCGAPSDKHHQLFHCPATATLREEHREVLQWVQRHAPHWAHGAFAVEHAQEPFLRLVHSTRRLVVEPGLAREHLQTLPVLHLFTDGSCSHPAIPPASCAAWAVVVDLCPSLTPGQLRAAWKATGSAPPNSAVLAQGLTVPRAELCALVQAAHVAAVHGNARVAIHVDASSALHAVGEVCSGSSPFKFAHPDLLQLLSAHSVAECLQKVKSHHQDLDQVPDGLLRAALGNLKADDAAKAARAQDLSCVLEAADRVASWREQQARMLKKYFVYLVELAQLVVPVKQSLLRADRDSVPQLDIGVARSRWLSHNDGVGLPSVLPDLGADILLVLQWPPWFTETVWRWAGSLLWPPVGSQTSSVPGVTYLELMVNFIVCEGILPPRLCRRGHHRRWINLCLGQGLLSPVVVTELLLTFVAVIRSLSRRTQQVLLQGKAHNGIRSLCPLSSEQGGRKGLQIRPSLQHPEVYDTMAGVEALLNWRVLFVRLLTQQVTLCGVQGSLTAPTGAQARSQSSSISSLRPLPGQACCIGLNDRGYHT